MTEEINRESTRSAVLKASTAIASSFQKTPYKYLFEFDIQAALFGLLRQKLPQSFKLQLDKTHEREFSYVYSEYQKYGEDRAKLDIVVLDPETAPTAVRRDGDSIERFLYTLPVWIGIELKFTLTGYPFSITGGVNDLKKLRRHLADSSAQTVHNGLAIIFVHDDNVVLDQGAPVQEIDSLDFLYIVSPGKLRRVPVE